MDVKIL